MYKIVVKKLNRWFEEVEEVEYTGTVKEQMLRLFDGSHSLKGSEDISRKLVFDRLEMPTSARGETIEEVKYRR